MDAAVDAAIGQFELNEEQRAIQDMAARLRRRSRRARMRSTGTGRRISRPR